ncbi:hypothetical protein GCM10027035_10880 [Emticicia sediminis]
MLDEIIQSYFFVNRKKREIINVITVTIIMNPVIEKNRRKPYSSCHTFKYSKNIIIDRPTIKIVK